MPLPHVSSPKPRIVIVGAGFGGFQAAASLAGAKAEVLLVDRNNYHTFVPLLYQVATGQIDPSCVAYPVRTLLRGIPNVQFLQTSVERVDFRSKLIGTDHGPIAYDYLVLATGAQTSYHGVPGTEYAFPMQTLGDAVTFRQHLFRQFERALVTPDEGDRRRLLSFVVVGGGPTGVEMAGALAELLKGPFRKDFPELAGQWRLVLVQSGPGLLSAFPQRLGTYTHRQLDKLGVDIRLNSRVQKITPTRVELPDGTIAAETVVWAAGTEAARPDLIDSVADTRKGLLKVGPTLQLEGWPNVYAIGDLAQVDYGKPLAGVAPEALQQGVTVARNLRRQLRSHSPKPFQYVNKGRLAIVGGYGGVGQIAGIPFSGFLAWILWLMVHLIYLPGYRNRLLVLLTWVHNYLLQDRAIRQVLPWGKF
ncbi:FAD-dependent oxidoreductase [filamentous cyanobacterium CCP5]|nr:FAD-dependent oxidoreductase [filamentous cyanobacterium CCP5]